MSQPCGGRDDQLGPRHRQQRFRNPGPAVFRRLGRCPAPCARGAPAGDDPGSWQRLFDWWGQLLPEQAQGAPEDAVRRFREQAGSWYGTMQEVAARFAGRRQQCRCCPGLARGGAGAGRRHAPVDAAGRPWQHATPLAPRYPTRRLAAAVPAAGGPWLQSPAFGPGREHQARWQALLRAQEEYQQHSRAYVDQIKQALDEPLRAVRAAPGEHDSPRARCSTCGSKPRRPTPRSPCPNRSSRCTPRWATRRCAARRPRSGRWNMSERIGLTRSEMDAAHAASPSWSAACAARRRRWLCWPEPLRSIRWRSRRLRR